MLPAGLEAHLEEIMIENPEGMTPEEPRKKVGRPKKVSPHANHSQNFATGKLLPAAPMNPDELAEAWQVGRDDVETVTIKVFRQRLGTLEQELMESVPLVHYDGERVAGNFGPGTYYLRAAPGKYGRMGSKLVISEALARSCGYGRIPVTAADMQAQRTLRQAADGPTDPLDLIAAIETVLDRREAERNRGQALAPAPVDPLAAMRTQFEQIQSMMAFMGSLEERAIKTVEMRMGRQDFIPTAEDTNSSLLEKLLPKALDIFGQMMANRNAAADPAPARVSVDQVRDQAERIKVVNPTPQPQQPEAPPMPALTPDEQKAIGGAVMMLRPFAAQLVDMANGPASDSEIVLELADYMPGPMIPSLKALAAVVAKHGPVALGFINPGLATDRWTRILPALIAELEA